MGKHRAPRKPDVPMRLAMVSTAALLTALVTADRNSERSEPTASRGLTTVGEPSGPFFAPPPASGPEALPDATSGERPFGDTEVTPVPESKPKPEPGGRHRREEPEVPVDDPETPHPRDVLSGATAAWISGTTQGYEWLVHLEQCIVSHMMPSAEQRSV
ncbi:hypothetical protein ABZ942_18030 [Nocardia sp. NPDC046473]|uniref:hypothetical protein n=1 Tax=Nocardia sp. NPDC046473 TaxID=3155733 RepID=UPI003408C34C